VRNRFTRFLLQSATVAVAASTFVACKQDKEHPAMPVDPGGTGGGHEDASTPPPVDPCLTPGHAGCACDETGAVTECGKVIQRSGDYVTCSIGRSTCDGQTWGECIGDHIVAKSWPGMALGASGRKILGTPVNCTNVCNPNDCKSVVNTGKDVDSGGVTITDAGVSITPGEAGNGGSGPCTGLWCNIASCDGGAKTTISGTVYDPAGKNPLYNAFVYIPVNATAPLPSFTSGASCDTCAGTGTISAIAMAQTGADGKFTLNTNVPSGTNIPLVVQMGKWRRKILLPTVTSCTNNVIAPSNSRLPKNRTDGDGNFADIPKMAIATGDADPFECLLLKAGIDASEIQFPSTAAARIHYYKFNGIDRDPGTAPAGSTLTGNLNTLKTYDVVLLPCEGTENNAHNSETANLVSYSDVGGRIFATHFGYQWLATTLLGVARNNSAFYGTANWYINKSGYNDPMTGNVDTSFPKGQAFAQWLLNVGASTTLGQMTINEPRWDAKSAINPPSQRWMYGKSSGSAVNDMLLSMTFNTPVAATPANQCGRVVFSDFHVSADALVSGSACNADTDCGFGATCIPPVIGTCDVQSCTTSSNCSMSGASCVGGSAGKCVPASCTSNSGSGKCDKGTCNLTTKLCACTQDSHCGSDDCNGGVCDPYACTTDANCGRSETCIEPVVGTCRKACTASSQCNGAICVSGFCTGCLTDSDCPGSSTDCNGAIAGHCSSTSSRFPLTCRNGDLSAQEKALEFMLFDLTACVSPDSWVPPAPQTVYSPVTFTQDFTSTCGKGQRPAWREFDWQDSIPSTASIVFEAQTADTVAALATTPKVPVVTDTVGTVLPAWDVALLDTTTGGVLRTASPPQISKNILRMTITLNPTSDKKASPTLIQWKVQYDCVDAE
jgi:hypothetical protein